MVYEDDKILKEIEYELINKKYLKSIKVEKLAKSCVINETLIFKIIYDINELIKILNYFKNKLNLSQNKKNIVDLINILNINKKNLFLIYDITEAQIIDEDYDKIIIKNVYLKILNYINDYVKLIYQEENLKIKNILYKNFENTIEEIKKL